MKEKSNQKINHLSHNSCYIFIHISCTKYIKYHIIDKKQQNKIKEELIKAKPSVPW